MTVDEQSAAATPDRDELSQLGPIAVAGHELTIYLESPPLIEAMLADIRAAKGRVWLECYIIQDDALGQAVAEALTSRAAEGLDVRLLYDALGSQWTPAAFFSRMEAAGVQVVAFHSLWEALRGLAFATVLNRRNHRKLLVIDDTVAYFGGMNVLDQRDAAIAEQERTLKHAAGWRDVHLRMAGPQQSELVESFDRSWRRANKLPVSRRSRAYRRGFLAPKAEALYFFDSGPGPKYTRASRVFSRLLQQTRRSLTFSMAYFIPTGRIRRELLRARRRGVAVRIIVPSRSDVPIVTRALRHMYPQLLRRGMAIFERQRRMLHSKVMVADGRWSVVGSCNLDPRSLAYNYEFVAVIRSTALAQALLAVCDYEAERSERITRETAVPASRWQRWFNRAAYQLRWWL